jgi:uncharacterized membrane protein
MGESSESAHALQVGRALVEWAAFSIEVLAVIMIIGTIVAAALPHWLTSSGQVGGYNGYRHRVGKGLLLGLELLVAADVIDTIVLRSSVQSILALGLLVVIRTFLSWSLQLEIDGHWPWHTGLGPRGSARKPEPGRAAAD